MQGEQRGVKEHCSGTDVKKAYDSVDHRWLEQMFSLHRFPERIGDVIMRLSAKWNSNIAVRIVNGWRRLSK